MVNQEAYALGANRSVIRDLFEYGLTRAAQVGPDRVYDYSLGNPSIPTPPEVDEAVRAVLGDTDALEIHGYTPAVGSLETRTAIAQELSRRYGTAIGPEELFICCGAAPGLAAVFKALAVPGARFLALAPYFPEYRPWVESAGAELDVVPPDVPDFQVNIAALEQKLTSHTVAVIVNSPNNPSGTVYTEKTLRALGELLRRKAAEFGHSIYIISDEPYRELVYGGVTAPYIPAIYPDTVVCYSYSKSLSLPGERIGYVQVPRQAAQHEKLYSAIAGAARALGHVCAPALWQRVIARCAHLGPDLAAYDKNRRALYEGLVAMGYEVAKPDGAFYLFVKAPGGDANAFSQRAKERDLLVVPGDSFGCPGYFRLCYCVSHEKILASLPIFKELITNS